MRRGELLFLAGLQLQLCAARQPGFSIHHDLLAFPQFEVVFSESYISEPEAKSLLESAAEPTQHPSYEAEFGDNDIISHVQPTASGEASNDGDHTVTETYEIMTMHPHRYLCIIPVIEAPPAPNKTATELAKAEEARELARATTHGWELVNELDGTCLYYVSGWWSYSFCYGHDVVQFHALPGHKGGPPVRDPNSQEYVLGRVQDSQAAASANTKRGRGGRAVPPAVEAESKPAPANPELQVKGDQRYLVQRLEDGTLCDLTNRPRTIEIQYHCSPGGTQDRIGWIKEVTTCAYLMLVNTPRLCTDVAFQPPREQPANIISCRTIVPESEQAAWHAQKSLEAQASMVGQQQKQAQGPVTIGGVVVGGHQLLGKGEDGKEATQLKPPRGFGNGGDGTVVEIVAMGTSKEEGSKLKVLSAEELEDLDLSPELIEQLKDQMQDLAGDRGWKLEVVEVAGNPETRDIRGIVESEDEEDEGEGDGTDANNGEGGDESDESDKGSEEKFFQKDEL
ncbi:glucosidase II beta subunit-like protein-domain-containing protein [Pseudomassariella vexata]|uniref:Endoplasmic reticulum lectin n=1 Tax=Pseudomassariella vexata TaxID=1141098 RepID=A0A1Y2DHJ0_9PEZI|nr:glucosidase II beta subunit-like protein-domain-containing protein [Pseudomassariella vexata]ORY58584.1 glucosidase II beta subunit-like protein-domain-containing protein [Pseudomassariella vexata]